MTHQRTYILRKPRPMTSGDRIAIVAPSSHFKDENLERGLAWLRSAGFEPVLGRNLRGRHRYLAGDDQGRASDLMAALTDPSIAGVICARGGYGSGRLLPLLDATRLRDNCKVLVGFSDITMLHLWLLRECSWVTFHGPMVGTKWAGEGLDPESGTSLLLAMGGTPSAVVAPNSRILHPGRVRGRLIGGNLSMLTHSIGTPFEPDLRDAILLIEDINEKPYRVDRMLTHLRQAGKLCGVRGIVVGDMLGCSAPEGADYTVDDVIADCLSDLKIPSLANFPVGHGKPNFTVALGIEYEIDADMRTLTPVESAFT